MPYYKITITDKQGRIRSGIRHNDIMDIDLFFRKTRQKAITTMKNNFEEIEVVMLSKYSPELRACIDKNRKSPEYIAFPEESTKINKRNRFDTSARPEAKT